MSQCLDENQLAQLLDGNAPEDALSVIFAHVDSCEYCCGMLIAVVEPQQEERPERIGSYNIERELGEGNMGQVYVGKDPLLDRHVAIKVLKAGTQTAGDRLRLAREAQAMARLQHPNVAAIFHLLELDSGDLALVYELIQGKSLDQLQRPVENETLLHIALGLARGLSAAHAASVLHRDIKPANAMLSRSGEAKLLDFGLAKLSESAEGAPSVQEQEGAVPALMRLTNTGVAVGTPLYIAPEIWSGHAASVQTDIYSLGVLLYELACGVVPHAASSFDALRKEVCASDAQPLRERAPGIEPRIGDIIDRCVSRLPARRYLTAGDLLRDLEEAARIVPSMAQAARRKRRVLMGSGAALVVLLAGQWAWPTREPPRVPQRQDSQPVPGNAIPPRTPAGPAAESTESSVHKTATATAQLSPLPRQATSPKSSLRRRAKRTQAQPEITPVPETSIALPATPALPVQPEPSEENKPYVPKPIL